MNQEAIGESEVFTAMMEQTSDLAKIHRPVIVFGERGVGKELVADRLHYHAPWWTEPFIKVNCGTLGGSLLDAELFGYEAGAFTGADKKRLGKIEAADGGTLFLDEIALASKQVQEKLLRVIEYGEFYRLSSNRPVKVSIRLVVASNQHLQALVDRKEFLPDLYDRLCFDMIEIPPLRDRGSDIRLLAEYFIRRFCLDFDIPPPVIEESAWQQLYQHQWPGNIRELKNVVERTVFGSRDQGHIVSWRQVSKPSGSPETPRKNEQSSVQKSFTDHVEDFERGLIETALTSCHGSQKLAAEHLKLSYHQFRGLLRKYGYKK
ncbi:sigma 54-interacting transcriptional regulator [Pseudobacteriovorax antillogorgiicola]|uniref:Psp operon transcriptional activator n=1 Tax=Pseudobacteriovorax antillogorgiicola TaxID=1513793 RepID=A0A1Y6BVA4_9BACT|nr:sigma 54-interacting transcriptional regulator [Pseudobacteriovorax antillogorgiicola]TCS52395.1 psp operon transcriptional activator [Pseudobacteriovorax antillogorgiicola]SMF29068.1 psp operon transcriptional activator [Pseudobacteriovorax antillogorgiicola]